MIIRAHAGNEFFYTNALSLNGFNILQHYTLYRLYNDEYKCWSIKCIIVIKD